MAKTKSNEIGGLQFDQVGYWSEVKLDIVRKYASAYSAILSKSSLNHAYINGLSVFSESCTTSSSRAKGPWPRRSCGRLCRSTGTGETDVAKSAIEWTQSTWNPVTGCSKVSPGCKHCYAERMAKRLQAMGQPNYVGGFQVALHSEMLEQPLSWKKPQTIFVNSMSDLFHEDVSRDFLTRVFDVMTRASWHTFQVLTKRAERLEEIAPTQQWPRNVWMGVSVESPAYLQRLNHLRNVPAAVRFVSFEPLLEALGVIDLKSIDWAVVGGESGPGARPIERTWVVDIRTQCQAARVPFFFKQWGGTNKKRNGRLLDGRTWDGLPRVVASAEEPLRVRRRERPVDPTSCLSRATSSDPRPMTR